MKYVTSAPDRHGRIRHRFRLNGVSRYLPGEPNSAEFDAAYKEALAHAEQALDGPLPRKLTRDEQRFPPGSVNALIRDFRATGRYQRLRPKTREQYDATFAKFSTKFGTAQVRAIDTKFVLKMMDGLKARPGVANVSLRILKLLLNFAIQRGDITSNPTDRVQPVKLGQWATWTEDHIAAFEKRWPLGTMERRAFNVALATGQRATDLGAMQTKDVKDGFITIRQSKTGAVLILPVIQELADDLAAFPPKGDHLIHRRDGKPYTRSAITHLIKGAMRSIVSDDDEKRQLLPDDLNLHGLRKAMCRRLAEAGASEREIMAVSGHKSPQMVSVYVAAANQKVMASAAMERLSSLKRTL